MKIGVCFPEIDFELMDFDSFLSYMIALKTTGVNSFDFYIDFFQKMDNKKEKLLMVMKDNDIKITLHYNGAIKDAEAKLDIAGRNMNVRYNVPIVFHLPSYDKNKYAHVKEIIAKIRELVDHREYDILIETLSKNHPNDQNLGDDISEINLFLKMIPDNNFGICWDIGHTRMNHIEERTSMFITDISRVKMVHVHNLTYKRKFFDHIPLTDLDLQDEEIKYLVKNGYNGIYSLEFPLNNIKENMDVYLDSVKKIKRLIEEEKNELRKDS